MMIGDKRRFAIEFELDEAKQRDPQLAPWLYGRVCWWAGNEAIGRYESDTTIRDLLIEAERFLANEGRRVDEHLAALSRSEVLHEISNALFDDHGQSSEQVEADEERYRPFFVKPDVDVFDTWDVFLVEGRQNARLIWRRHDEDDARECVLHRGEFEAILRAFLMEVRKTPPGTPPGVAAPS